MMSVSSKTTKCITTTLLLSFLGNANAKAILGAGVREAFKRSEGVGIASAKPSVNVLVMLKGEGMKEGGESTLTSEFSLKLEEAQKNVATSMAREDAEVSVEYKMVPAMAFHLHSEASLDKLMSNEHVEEIGLDEEMIAFGGVSFSALEDGVEPKDKKEGGVAPGVVLLGQMDKDNTEKKDGPRTGNLRAENGNKKRDKLSGKNRGGGGDEVYRPLLNEASALIRSNERVVSGNGGSGVTVAIVDTGCDVDHPDLSQAIVDEACFLQAGECPKNRQSQDFGPGSANDDQGHGTHVAGIVTSAGNNNQAPQGIAPETSIICLKVLSASGSGLTSNIVQGLEWLLTNHANNLDLINMSLGGGIRRSGDCDNAGVSERLYASVISRLREQNVLTLAAAGNDGDANGMNTPACVSAAFAVGASDNSDVAATFTNSNGQTAVMAPGVFIESARMGGGSVVLSGTSMATPVTAGCAALLIQSGDAATPDDVAARLELSDQVVSHGSFDFPRVNCKTNPEAVCNRNVVVAGCDLTNQELIDAIDGGSVGSPISYSFDGFRQVGPNQVTMTIADGLGLSSNCTTTVIVTGPTCETPSPTTMPTSSPTVQPPPGFRVGGEATFAIPSYGTQTISITITDEDNDCEIADLDVEIGLQHSFAADLDVRLCHPDGTCVWLFTDIGSSTALDSRKIVTLDDEADSNIATTIFNGSPVGTPEWDSLSKFDGKRVLGVWRLHLTDDSFSDGGYFYSLFFDVTCAIQNPTVAPSSAPSQSPTTSTMPTLSQVPSQAPTTMAPTFSPTASPTSSPNDYPTKFRVGGDGTFPIPRSGSSGTQTIELTITSQMYNCQIADIDVEIGLRHYSATDLDVRLCSPSGTCVWLFTDIGGYSALDSRKTILLDDEAPGNIKNTIYDTNPVGTPEWDSLSKFDGQSVLGVWQLHFNDDAVFNTGYFYSLYFEVTCVGHQEPPTANPTARPTISPTISPTASPTSPTMAPTASPSQNPTTSPTGGVVETISTSFCPLCFMPLPMPWNTAQLTAQKNGCALASVETIDDILKASIEFSSHLIDEKYWVGGYQSDSDLLWYWADGAPFSGNRWAPGEPNRISDEGVGGLTNYTAVGGHETDGGLISLFDESGQANLRSIWKCCGGCPKVGSSSLLAH